MTPARASRRDLIEFIGRKTIRAVCLLWLFGLILLLLELAFASLLQRFLAALELIATPNLNNSWFFPTLTLNKLVLLILLVAALRSLLNFAQVVVGGGAVEGFSHRIRRLLVESCLDSSAVRSSETVSLFNQRIYTASIAIQSVQMLTLQGILSLGILASLFLMSPLPTILLLLAVLMISLPARELNKRVKRSATMHAEALTKIMLHLNNVFRNFLLIRLFNQQKNEKSRILSYLKTYSDCIAQYYWVEGLLSALAPLAIVLTILWVAFVQNTTLAIDRRLAVPFLYLSFRFAQNLAPILSNASRLAFASTEFRYTFRWWLEQKEMAAVKVGAPSPLSDETKPIRSAIGWMLNEVTFGYCGQTALFNNFQLEVAPGSLVRVRGSSGVGKSTLVRLMLGDALPARGAVEVRLDGELFPAHSATARIREHLGYSSTEPFLFEGSIYENVTYGLKSPPDEDFLLESTARAECQFILEMPRRFEHQIDELGQGLSTGQKQRLSLLRALLRRPKALILDEALSSVDLKTENRILENLVQVKRECTILLISHREHRELRADAVLNLDDNP